MLSFFAARKATYIIKTKIKSEKVSGCAGKVGTSGIKENKF